MNIGILGGGQLARMLGEAGSRLALDFTILDPQPQACAGRQGRLMTAPWDDANALDALARCDRVTCDFENVPANVMTELTGRTTVHPSAEALAAAQDRLVEKRLFAGLGIEVPPFAPVSTRPELLAALDEIGYPAVLKTRRMGYDGKGQALLQTPEDLEPAWADLGDHALILEGFVDFDFECAITMVRGIDGKVVCYPLSRTVHHDGILRLALAPAGLDPALQAQAERIGQRLVEHLQYVGCLTLELFRVGDRLLANEFAPRVHNSAHWTIEGAQTSQFENHLRAVCHWPLGSTDARGRSLMINFIGQMPDRDAFLAVPGLQWHDYGKSARPGRKVGHATVTESDQVSLDSVLARLKPALDDQTLSLFDVLMNSSA